MVSARLREDDDRGAKVANSEPLKRKSGGSQPAPVSMVPLPLSLEDAQRMRGTGWLGDLDGLRSCSKLDPRQNPLTGRA